MEMETIETNSGTTTVGTEPVQENQTEEKKYSQADLDRYAAKALETSNKNRERDKAEAEKQRLIDERKYKDLWEQSEAKNIENEKAKFILENNLNPLAPVLQHVPLDKMNEVKELWEKGLAEAIEKAVNEKLVTPKPVTITGNNASITKPVKDWSNAEKINYLNEHSIEEWNNLLKRK